MRLLLAVAVIISVMGCTTARTEAGKSVQLMRADPDGCKELGYISATDAWLGDPVSTNNKLFNEAAKKGANVLVIDELEKWAHGKTAAIYQCQKRN